MKINEYQERAMRTCMPTCDNISYMLLNLVGEVGEFASKVGEFASKVAKALRKGTARIDENDYMHDARTPAEEVAEERAALKAEEGDIAWQLAGLCHAMGWRLEDVCQEYLEKLASRQRRGVIDGNGDNR